MAIYNSGCSITVSHQISPPEAQILREAGGGDLRACREVKCARLLSLT